MFILSKMQREFRLFVKPDYFEFYVNTEHINKSRRAIHPTFYASPLVTPYTKHLNPYRTNVENRVSS